MMTAPDSIVSVLDSVVTAELMHSDVDLTSERIRESINLYRMLPAYREVSDVQAEELARKLEERHVVRMGEGFTLRRPHQPWLAAATADIDPFYWNRYRSLLIDKGFSRNVLTSMNMVADKVLDLTEDPRKSGTWSRRGLVVGNVQSGKTANYLGLICKAADAGYRVIIVIAGIHNNLRNQTQTRVDEGFIGKKSTHVQASAARRQPVGVGLIDGRRSPASFTSSTRDFSKAGADQVNINIEDYKEPVVFVIKKNPTTLRNLNQWLADSKRQGAAHISAPLLLIDDEADNASINVSPDPLAASRINAEIRELLGRFERSAYIGFTATPFANIFIDPDTDEDMRNDDLFPRDFIVSLDPPSNYFGSWQVFLDEEADYVRPVEDYEDHLPLGHRITHRVESLPPSLEDAIRAFVLARAIRIGRGQVGEHNSMLVNASRFTGVQERLSLEISHFLEELQAAVRMNSRLSWEHVADRELHEIHRVWETEYAEAGLSWSEVLQLLHDAAAPIRVVTVNARSSDSLKYSEFEESGLNVIAVGGLSLSRGLTLEGLIVTYFLRNSLMYDTLLQMGRWFGFRPGYQDLCRIWMPPEAIGYYRHISEAIEEMRDDLRTMERAGGTPEDFGLRVRSHPDALLVTARNKMRSGQTVVAQVGLSDRFIETVSLRQEHLDANHALADDFVASLAGAGSRMTGGWFFPEVDASQVIAFLSRWNNDPASVISDPEPVVEYIRQRIPGELEKWDVLVASLQQRDVGSPEVLGGLDIRPQNRRLGTQRISGSLRIGDNQRVSSRGVEKTGLSEAQIAAAEREYDEDESAPGRRSNYPDRIYRAKRTRPLLVLHLLSLRNGETGSVYSPAVAWSISFPPSLLPQRTVQYTVNLVWMREYFGEELEEEDVES